jgi:trehalose 6-phosphate phosphatase
MNNILKSSEKKLLSQFAQANTALVFDYDGTLAPIVKDPGAAVVPPKTKALLAKVNRLYPSAVLSGRSLKNLRERIRGIDFEEAVGNHGMEFSHSKPPKQLAAKVAKWKLKLGMALFEGRIDGEGLEIEDKTVSMSVHYRNSRHPAKVAKQLRLFFKELAGVRVVDGKCVFNLLPTVRKNKGTAIIELKKALHCDHIVFIGDDVTDEDVFVLKDKRKILDIRVGKSARSKARYYLAKQTDIDKLLKILIELRTSELRTRKSSKSRGASAPAKATTSRRTSRTARR